MKPWSPKAVIANSHTMHARIFALPERVNNYEMEMEVPHLQSSEQKTRLKAKSRTTMLSRGLWDNTVIFRGHEFG